ncbi:MAG: hypothetical protein ACFE9L_11755 [Candidatus Hodarchaeota archaeon]
MALVGLQTNSEHVSTEEGLDLAKKFNMRYYETQVTDLEQIQHIFSEFTRQVFGMKAREV